MKLSRRYLVAGSLAGAGATIFPGLVKQANAATVTRYNLATPNGQTMLKKYAQAVKIMMGFGQSSVSTEFDEGTWVDAASAELDS